MANYKTGAQRYNDRMDKIFKKSEELGHHSLHGKKEVESKEHESKAAEKKEKMARKMSKKTDFGKHNIETGGSYYGKSFEKYTGKKK